MNGDQVCFHSEELSMKTVREGQEIGPSLAFLKLGYASKTSLRQVVAKCGVPNQRLATSELDYCNPVRTFAVSSLEFRRLKLQEVSKMPLIQVG